MIPTNGSSFGRAGGRLRRAPGGTENASIPETPRISAPVRGSIPNRRAASRRLIPSTYPARRTCPYSSTPFIPPPSAHLGRRPSAAGFLLRPCRPIRPLYEGLSLRRSHYRLRMQRSQQFDRRAGVGVTEFRVVQAFASIVREIEEGLDKYRS